MPHLPSYKKIIEAGKSWRRISRVPVCKPGARERKLPAVGEEELSKNSGLKHGIYGLFVKRIRCFSLFFVKYGSFSKCLRICV
jgi:hypothetical protein